jgi:hyperosmotically inducible protein
VVQRSRRPFHSRTAFKQNSIQFEEIIMKYARALTFAAIAGITVVTAGCSVARNQQTVGSYVDDAGITTAVKAKMAEDKTVSATSISVETLNGTVQLSGFAKSQAEKNQAEVIARNSKNVRDVRNNIVVRP